MTVLGAEGCSSATLGEVLTAHRRRRFVGRSAELELFRSALDGAGGPAFSVLHVHGPGGIGKTSLLEAMTDVAGRSGATVVRLDGSELDPSPVSVLEALAKTLSVPGGGGPISLPGRGGRLVLLLDAYERVAPLDDWIRDRLLPRLPASTKTVIACRNPPSPAWRTDPAWQDLLRVVALRNLSPEDSRSYLRKSRVDPRLHDRILRITYGHPLGLALLTDVVSRGGQVEPDVMPLDMVEVLLPRFLETVTDARGRRALGACTVARRTTEPLLRDVLAEDDVHDVFIWLQALSFIETRPDGLSPHDLSRDVLDADLRWRDFDTYRDIFHKVRQHSLSALRTTTGRAQQRAIFDLKFLFRLARTAMSPVEWDTWGEYYPEPARLEDRGSILELVRLWEGEQSAAVAARWLERQPEGFSVIRDQNGEVRGMLAILDLARASRDDIAADPGARAAWDFAHSGASPRPGEGVTICRFVVDRDSYQGPSPTLNATPILTLQKELATPNLSWDFLTLADADQWDEYFAAADLPRAAGADFTVGGRRYGLFAHDFRKVPVDAVTERWTEQALAKDVHAASREHTKDFLVLSHPDFEAAVRQGFKDLRRRDLLARNPLVRTRLFADHTRQGESSGSVVEALLREAAMTLTHHPRDDKLFRAVERTYLRPAATQEAAAAALGLPFSTYRRHLTRGMADIVRALWEQELYGQDRAEVGTSRPGM